VRRWRSGHRRFPRSLVCNLDLLGAARNGIIDDCQAVAQPAAPPFLGL
jgi:hypothetical protein